MSTIKEHYHDEICKGQKESFTKEHAILFSTPMVQALNENRKSQTRRIVKTPKKAAAFKVAVMPDGTKLPFGIDDEEAMMDYIKCPYGHIGDILWVRERWRYSDDLKVPIDFYADYESNYGKDYLDRIRGTWKPSIFMPKEACRIKLEITDIRVERLHDITEEDAIAEGILELAQSAMQRVQNGRQFFDYSKKPELFNDGLTAEESYKSLWTKINGNDAWNSNPWVWVIEFEKI